MCPHVAAVLTRWWWWWWWCRLLSAWWTGRQVRVLVLVESAKLISFSSVFWLGGVVKGKRHHRMIPHQLGRRRQTHTHTSTLLLFLLPFSFFFFFFLHPNSIFLNVLEQIFGAKSSSYRMSASVFRLGSLLTTAPLAGWAVIWNRQLSHTHTHSDTAGTNWNFFFKFLSRFWGIILVVFRWFRFLQLNEPDEGNSEMVLTLSGFVGIMRRQVHRPLLDRKKFSSSHRRRRWRCGWAVSPFLFLVPSFVRFFGRNGNAIRVPATITLVWRWEGTEMSR